MTSQIGNLSSEPHPFLRHSSDPESHKRDSQQPPATILSATRWACAELPPASDEAKTVIERLATWEQYSALALCLDDTEGGRTPESMDQIIRDLILDAETHQGAVGCRWTDNLYFIALPNSQIPEALQLAKQIQKKLGAQRPETISIGMAPYPLLAYRRKHCWSSKILLL